MSTEDPTDVTTLRVDNEVVGRLAEVAEMMTEVVDRMVFSRKGYADSLVGLKEDLKEARDSIKGVSKILMEGNGQKPLISRVAVLEAKMDDVEEELTFLVQRDRERDNIDKKGRWAMATAVISGILALATAIITAL